tara:strand:+ start:1286 stop:1432 length:147 start_codon:yes stop_codon:yes gene_type:complete
MASGNIKQRHIRLCFIFPVREWSEVARKSGARKSAPESIYFKGFSSTN